ncbi:membrane protein [Achromobacter sp. DH1f]|uniref:COG4648 family protein n=1 Tax=Achromobacter sp. DH1f TaxID=1397275 RepID=UPI000468FF57|nr:membrane protein [Achromobacter sp. DH1f]
MMRGAAPALAIAGLAYPFVVHATLGRVDAAWLALPLALLWLARALTRGADTPGGRLLPLAAVAFCLVLAVSNSQDWLRWYPVMINAMLLAVFGASLRRGRPVIERLARLRHPDLPEAGVRYTRKVTQVWCGFFTLNGAIAAALAAWAPWTWWTAYNGAISYALMGLLLGGEWLLRPAAAKAV